MSMKDQAAVVGVGATPLYRRGASYPQESELSLACKAVLAACEDAGISVADIDGFADQLEHRGAGNHQRASVEALFRQEPADQARAVLGGHLGHG